MSDLLDQIELDGLRNDHRELLGDDSTTAGTAKTTVKIERVLPSNLGPINEDTLEYDASTVDLIYTGPFSIAPVIFRRDRQEIAGGATQRIRQYRGKGPWDMPRIELDDVLTVLTSQDPWIVGLVLTVTDDPQESELGVRRIGLVDTSTPNPGDC